jgi:hypothetical protein
MDRVLISDKNWESVELAIMVEASTNARGMDPMKEDSKEKAFLSLYVSIINEIPDKCFEGDVRQAILQSYKGARKKVLDGSKLWRKYKNEINELRNFSYNFTGVGSLAELPSGTAKLHQMKHQLIMKLWKEKYPVSLFHYYFIDISVTHQSLVLNFLSDILEYYWS